MTFRSRPFLNLCAGRPCIACGADDGTIVPAHRNHGKGMAIKASDAWTLPLCMVCHAAYDSDQLGTRVETDDWFCRLYAQHIDNLLTEGRLTIDGKPQKEPKPAARLRKILPRPYE